VGVAIRRIWLIKFSAHPYEEVSCNMLRLEDCLRENDCSLQGLEKGELSRQMMDIHTYQIPNNKMLILDVCMSRLANNA
jgi:hypothetical protein